MLYERSKKNESEVFKDLELLCESEGYLHAVAYFCFRDNLVRCGNQIEKENFLEQYGESRLLRNEISTLIGLACKVGVNIKKPEPKDMQRYIDETEVTLEELHKSMMPDISEMFKVNKDGQLDRTYNPFREGKFLREPIFYGGESAFHFQYRDLSKIKYRDDESWLVSNKGYSLNDLFSVIEAIGCLQLKKINEIIPSMLNDWTVLDAYIFTVEELITDSALNISKDVVKNVIESFVSTDKYSFDSIDDFNQKNAFPILKVDENQYLLFQNYSLLEALYESPFFWFWEDKDYRNTAMKNRGDFTENFATDRLGLVFGNKRVFQNVIILDGKETVGEIDVLVIFANRAIVLQAKSKKLTINSRKGNDNSLQTDFKKAVQDAYNQAYSCSELILNKSLILQDEDGNEIDISNIEFEEIYPVCLTSEHYPALFFQTRHFLEYQETKIIKSPFVTDVFCLDVITEMLSTPLYFLSYLNRRVEYSDKIISHHEITVLAYHLKNNLWFSSDMQQVMIADDFNAELDMAMLTRRDGLQSIEVPEGILTKYKNTNIERFISQIEHRNNTDVVDFGFMLLKVAEETAKQIHESVDMICSMSVLDKKTHDITIAFDVGEEGLTIHANFDDFDKAKKRLETHARLRKYCTRYKKWHAVCLDPVTKKIRFGLQLNFPWIYSRSLEKQTQHMAKARPLKALAFGTVFNSKKIGRNEKCHCGSGKKYKKCCL